MISVISELIPDKSNRHRGASEELVDPILSVYVVVYTFSRWVEKLGSLGPVRFDSEVFLEPFRVAPPNGPKLPSCLKRSESERQLRVGPFSSNFRCMRSDRPRYESMH